MKINLVHNFIILLLMNCKRVLALSEGGLELQERRGTCHLLPVGNSPRLGHKPRASFRGLLLSSSSSLHPQAQCFLLMSRNSPFPWSTLINEAFSLSVLRSSIKWDCLGPQGLCSLLSHRAPAAWSQARALGVPSWETNLKRPL